MRSDDELIAEIRNLLANPCSLEEPLTFYRLPRHLHKKLISTNLPERLIEELNEEIKLRTTGRANVLEHGCLPRMMRALTVEMHEDSIEAGRYLNMEYVEEEKKELMRRAACKEAQNALSPRCM